MGRGKYTDAEILDMMDSKDITYVSGKDPSRFYFHAENTALRVEELKRQGFRVEEDDDGATPDSPVAIQSDGTSKVVNLPGHILMSRPKDLDEKIRTKRRDRFEDIANREQEESLEKVKREMDKSGLSSKLKKVVQTSIKEY